MYLIYSLKRIVLIDLNIVNHHDQLLDKILYLSNYFVEKAGIYS